MSNAPENKEIFIPEKPLDVRYEWIAHERHWVPKTRGWFVSYAALFTVLIAIAALLSEFILIMAIIAFVFLWFTQAAVPPEQVTHAINPFGIKTFGKLYKWKFIKHFWFSEKDGIEYLNLDIDRDQEGGAVTPRRISLLLENNEMEQLFWLLVEQIDYGDRDEVGYNFLAKILYGTYIPITSFLPEEVNSQEEYLLNKDLIEENEQLETEKVENIEEENDSLQSKEETNTQIKTEKRTEISIDEEKDSKKSLVTSFESDLSKDKVKSTQE